MNRESNTRILITTVMLLVGALAQAGLPLAPTITYGLIRDEYGNPVQSGAVATLVRAASPETVCAQHEINGLLHVGVNYRLSLELEGAAPLARTYAALVGEAMLIQVTVGGVEQTLIPAGTFSAPAAGSVRRVDFSTGVDSDGDGLPDAWEELMVAWSDGFYTSIHDILPGDDSDGDGMTNEQEYRAGTLPFLATDLLAITDATTDAATGRMAITFLTTDTRRYHVIASPSLDEPTWTPIANAATPGGKLEYQSVQGTGRSVTVYVAPSVPSAFFRIGVN